MRPVLRSGAVAALLAFLLAVALEAAQHRMRLHRNASITVLGMTEGPDGLLWLAADDAVYRFDGYHYQKVQGFPFDSARSIVSTRDGSVWVGGLRGLARYRNGFSVVLRDYVVELAAHGDRVFAKTTNRLFVARADGSVQEHHFGVRHHMSQDPSGRLWLFTTGDSPHAIAVDPERFDGPSEKVPLPDVFWQIGVDAQGRMWAADASRAVEIRDGRGVQTIRRRYSQKTPRASPLLPGRNGQLWFIGETIYGLSDGEVFQDRVWNDQYLPTAAYEDSRGHLWVAKLGLGLIEWVRNPGWERWSATDFGGQPVAQVVRSTDGHIVAATHDNIFRLNTTTGTWAPIADTHANYAAVLPLEEGGLLASVRKLGLARLSADGKFVECPLNPLPSNDEYRRIVRDGSGQVWVGNKLSLLRLDGSPGSLVLHREPLPRVRPERTAQAVDLEVDRTGQVWVGYAAGLAWRDKAGKWFHLPTDTPVALLRSFTFGRAGTADEIWVAYRTGGKFSRLQKQGDVWKVTDFAASSGYGPEDTHFIKRGSRGWIWRGTPDGVFISDGTHVEPDDWLHITLGNGLATESTDQYGFFEDVDGSVWIAGEEGVSHLRPDPEWFAAPRQARLPQITWIEVDGVERAVPLEALVLRSSSAKVRLGIGSLDAPPFRDSPLRYRLRPLFGDWRYSRDGTLEFSRVGAGEYTLEVGFTGAGNASVATIPLQFGNPAGASWPWLLRVSLAGGMLALVGRVLASERARYRLAKGLFLIRRRFSPHKRSSASATAANVRDYSGHTFLDRYRVERVASRGGCSVVYEARDLRNGQNRLAVKILTVPEGHESWLRGRFAHEIAALRSVTHPAVVRILDSWITLDGEPGLAMPFLEGPTLRDALRDGPFAPDRVTMILRHLGSALSELHARGIVHRDLKPENVMFTDSGCSQPVIIDFGTAGLQGRLWQLSQTTLLAGSFAYMAPERLTGHYSPATDLYSLGVITLEMLTGKSLHDLGALPEDEPFLSELEHAVAAAACETSCKDLASELSGAYRSRPQERPTDIAVWSERIAALLEGHGRAIRSAIQRMPKS